MLKCSLNKLGINLIFSWMVFPTADVTSSFLNTSWHDTTVIRLLRAASVMSTQVPTIQNWISAMCYSACLQEQMLFAFLCTMSLVR